MYCCFFLSLRSQFIFDFSFQKFDYYTTWCGFLGFFLFGVCSASRICQFMNFTKTVEFSAIIYLSSFTVASSFYSSGHSDELEVRSFVINPQFLQVLFMFFSLFFLPLFRLGNFYCSFIKFPGSVLYPLHSAIESIHWFVVVF